MAIPGYKPRKGEILRAWFDFIFGVENKRGELLDYWIAFHDSLALPPQEFYEAIEKALQARKVPGMEISREEFTEGGVLSDQRIYLRLFRERLAIYTCAAPFGTGYFFSCRMVHVPALVRLWHILFALAFFAVVGKVLIPPLSLTFAAIAIVALMFALAGVMRNAAASTIADFDALLLKIPAVSTIYQDWFRADTYYRDDTRAIYLQRIPQVIRELADEMTAAKGAKLVQQYRYAPIFGELYKPLPSQPEQRTA